ncbi:MAG: pyridoxamine 5'-phosphate oxidase [Sphingobacteriia bacterium]|nr:pyridoxamine 5'-phosphate oxidase [Candidatus Fonsibacter lacus]
MDELNKYISKLREDFTKGKLNKEDVHQNPAIQFETWLNQAVEAKIPEVQAMTLSTVSKNNSPSSRIVYLREFGENQFYFYGNYGSRKALQLKENSNACLNFFWPQLERQIRIEGHVKICDNAISDAYFNARPIESKIGAWASQQSEELVSREELEKCVEKFKNKFEGQEIKRPPYWGGWIFTANYYEFWQGRKSRLHDRICYNLKNTDWSINRIAP